MMSKGLLVALILALQPLQLTATIEKNDVTDLKRQIASLHSDDEAEKYKYLSDKTRQVESLNSNDVEEALNEILDIEHEYLDEEDDVVLWRAVVTSLAEWNYLQLLKHNSTRQKREKEPICYLNVGCFTNDGPYSHLSLPTSPEEIDTKFYLYTRVKEEPDLISYMNVTSVRSSSFNSTHGIKVIIHGFGSSCRRVWAKEMRQALMSVDNSNVVCVDWEKGAALPNYPRATSNTRLVGRQVSILVSKIHEVFGTNNSQVHLIGFSLGAHVAGYAGAELRNVSRITGLDPAGPMFENQDTEARLDKTDGTFVDVIHSNGESLIMGGLGAWAPMGHIDFYPNGGRMQKGCTNLFLGAVTDIIFSSTPGDGRSLCNHRRAYKFFTDSVVPKCLFPAFPCDSYDKFLSGECFPCSDDKCGNMGYYADQSPGRGIMYLATRDEEPFCANQFRVIVHSSYNFPEAVSRGKLEITFIGESGYNETFFMTKGPDIEMRSGGKMVRMVVANNLLQQPTKIRLIYSAYNGWITSGLPYWSLDKLVVTDSFGKNFSFCQTGLILPTGVSTTITLSQGDCIPAPYDVYSSGSDQIWKVPDINSKVVPLSGDVNIVDQKLQLVDPSTGRFLSNNNSTHRFFDSNNTAAIYPYGPVPINVLQQHIPANIKVGGRKPLIPSLRFISSIQRHFKSKKVTPQQPNHLRPEFYPPLASRPIKEIPLNYKEAPVAQYEPTNQTFELFQNPRPVVINRPPARGEQGGSSPQSVQGPPQPPRNYPNYERRPPETVYIQAPGESPFHNNQATLHDYFIPEPLSTSEKMNGRREITNKHLGQNDNQLIYQSGPQESTSVTYGHYPDQPYRPIEVPKYAQGFIYEPETEHRDTDGYHQKGEAHPYGVQNYEGYISAAQSDEGETYRDASQKSVSYYGPQNVEVYEPSPGPSLQFEKGQAYNQELSHSLQTESTVVYRQTDGSVKVVFLPNQTREYDDQLIAFTEREDVLEGDPEFEYQYYDDDEYEDVSGSQILKKDQLVVATATTAPSVVLGTRTVAVRNVSEAVGGVIRAVTKQNESSAKKDSENATLQQQMFVTRNLSYAISNISGNDTVKLVHENAVPQQRGGGTRTVVEVSNASSISLNDTIKIVGENAPPQQRGGGTSSEAKASNRISISGNDTVKLVRENAAPQQRGGGTRIVVEVNVTSNISDPVKPANENVPRNISDLLTKTLDEEAFVKTVDARGDSSQGNRLMPSQTDSEDPSSFIIFASNARTSNLSEPNVTLPVLPPLQLNFTKVPHLQNPDPAQTTLALLTDQPTPDRQRSLRFDNERQVRVGKEQPRPLPVTIMASVELTTTAPATATELFTDNSNLVAAQFVNLPYSESRRGKKTKSSGNIGRSIDGSSISNTVESHRQMAMKRTEDTVASNSSEVTNATPISNPSPVTISNVTEMTGTHPAVNLASYSKLVLEQLSALKIGSEGRAYNLTRTELPRSTSSPPKISAAVQTSNHKLSGDVESSSPSANKVQLASLSSPAPPVSNDPQLSVLNDFDTLKGLPDLPFRSIGEGRNFPEVPKTLLKFSAEDRVTERSRKAAEALKEVQQAPLAYPVKETMAPSVYPGSEPVAPPTYSVLEPVAQPTYTMLEPNAPPVLIEAPVYPELPQAPGQQRSLSQYAVAQEKIPETIPFRSEPATLTQNPPTQLIPYSNPFGIPFEKMIDRNRPTPAPSVLSKPEEVARSLQQPLATNLRRNDGQGRRVTMIYNPRDFRAQLVPYQPEQRHLLPVPQPDPEYQQRYEEPPSYRSDHPVRFQPDDVTNIDRSDYAKLRVNQEDWAPGYSGGRNPRFDDHQRQIAETAKLQTLSRDLMPPPEHFEGPGNRRRSRLNRYGSWIPNIWSYISNPFSARQDETDPKAATNGWLNYVWGQQQGNPQLLPPGGPSAHIQPVISNPSLARMPVKRTFKTSDRMRTPETGVPNPEYLFPVQ